MVNKISLRIAALFSLGSLVVAGCGAPAAAPTAAPAPAAAGESAAPAAPASTEPIYFGVSGPLTGQNARYGEQWKKGFDLALEEINGAGGVNGRKIEYIFEDSQSDPKQSVVVAQKFVADPRIVVEIGDFSSGASMAASKIYERGGLVQFGMTNSHPDFTKGGGEYTWSNSSTQAQQAPALAELAVSTLGFKKPAVLFLNTDWGKTTYQLFEEKAAALGAQIVANEAYLPEEKDFKSALTRVRDANPDGLVLISYQADGALIVQQLEGAGLKLPIVGASSLQSPDFLKLGGKAAEGVLLRAQFLPSDPEPRVKNFVDKYTAKYKETPDFFATHAYDTMKLLAEAVRLGGATREGVKGALGQLKDVPSVIYGKVTFDKETRRVSDPTFVNLIVKNGEFVAWDGKQ